MVHIKEVLYNSCIYISISFSCFLPNNNFCFFLAACLITSITLLIMLIFPVLLLFTTVSYSFPIITNTPSLSSRDVVESLRTLSQCPSLVPPFNNYNGVGVSVQPRIIPDDEDDDDDINNILLPGTVADTVTTHFGFLIHGYHGLSKDLSYFQTIMQQQWTTSSVEKKKKRQHQSCHSNRRHSKMDFSLQHDDCDDMVIHNTIFNEGKTTDGVINGGDRLVQEMRDILK